ncbi:hypothetical protein CH373_02370 [Leptospira perolatii]|uniref:Uncharacterized protein n=1 Tax=Leptospira perolatii TaxID=2023191 RepID=A0A2M9ZS27_9LEPT|nr:hypothetical protein [Leptospira perolatii]PJZ71363.1 hypothetical protein CH360_02370 [Leptospira perolatii]PJZ74897.1 hypothetical protein CH373_02370 [Leptospira perolatii]
MLLKDGSKFENVKVKLVQNGFEVKFQNGSKRVFSSSSIKAVETQKTSISSNSPANFGEKPARSEANWNEVPNSKDGEILEKADNSDLLKMPKSVDLKPQETSQTSDSLLLFAGGMIPGWSPLIRSTDPWKRGTGFGLSLLEIYLAYNLALYYGEKTSLLEKPGPSMQLGLIPFVVPPDQRAIVFGYGTMYLSQRFVLANGREIELETLKRERDAFALTFLSVLVLDGFLSMNRDSQGETLLLKVSLLQGGASFSFGKAF